MQGILREVEVYQDAEGRAPFDDWMEALRDRKARTIIDVRITRVEAGNFGDYASVGEGICQLRINSDRVIGCTSLRMGRRPCCS